MGAKAFFCKLRVQYGLFPRLKEWFAYRIMSAYYDYKLAWE